MPTLDEFADDLQHAMDELIATVGEPEPQPEAKPAPPSKRTAESEPASAS